MQISQDLDVFSYTIRAYDSDSVTINLPLDPEQLAQSRADPSIEAPKLKQEQLHKSFIIAAKHLTKDWGVKSIQDLNETDIEAFAKLKPELVIIGTGKRAEWPPMSLFKPLINQGIGFEIMDTSAACRTYNILSFEGRQVMAGLIL